MPVALNKGGNVSLSKEEPNLRRVLVGLGWDAAGANYDLDASAFLLTTQGRVRSDNDFVFYNQPASPEGSVRHLGDSRTGLGANDDEQITVDLGQVPADIDRIAFSVTIHDAEQRRQSFGQIRSAYIRVANQETLNELARYNLSGDAGSETAMIFGELYRRGPEWKFRAVGQGFSGGLGPLASSFGVDVAGEPSPAPPPPPQPAAPPRPTPPPQPAPPPTPAAPPINLSKITLKKTGESISLAKQAAGFGQIVVNLNWTKGGGGMFRKKDPIDLDLCCLFILKDGMRGGVQALGNNLGDYHRPPFMKLDGDDRTGDVAQGEFLRINGEHWAEIDRVLIFSFIYEGVPNWAAADGVVTVTVPGEPVLEVRMDSHNNQLGTCAIAMLENDNGGIKVTKLVEYFRANSEMDRAYNFGLRWVAGSKD